MKIVTAKEMARIEKLAYSQGASEEGFMNKAGLGVANLTQRLIAEYHLKPNITLLCGSGNNAGDAYVAGRILHEGGFHVHALSLTPFEKSSPLCQLQSERFIQSGGLIEYVSDINRLSFANAAFLIDGLLGTGFHGEVQGLFSAVIEKANASALPILSVDIPSGINGTTGEIGGMAIVAQDTLFLGLPKIGCFLKEAWNYTGRVHLFDFGLGSHLIDQAEEEMVLIEHMTVKNLLPRIERTRHKYQAGYVIGVGGSPGMPGAPIMASFAALRSGAGIVRLLHPKGMEAELAAAPFELIKQGFKDAQEILLASKRAHAIFIGPGIGLSPFAVDLLREFLSLSDKPCVIDADALTLIASHKLSLPKQTILTPHHGEMKRLLQTEENLSSSELLEKSHKFASENHVTLVLKGAPTFIFHDSNKPWVCGRGDSGMATAGSGDVLTGIIAAFLAQTGDPFKAALLGVHLHAVAGEYAAKKWTSYSMTATDIIDALPFAFKELESCRECYT